MKIEDICKVQYLSCVEAYFGAWVKDKIPLGALYCESFLSWTEILKAFSSYETYANFSKIRRLQDFAEHIGLISHKMTDTLLSSDQFDVKTLTLFAVNDSFFVKRKAWREDHYIAINEY